MEIAEDIWRDPPCWNYPEEVCGVSAAGMKEVWRSIAKDENFWLELEPLPGADVAIGRLWDLRKEHDIYFVTIRHGASAKRQSEIWLSLYGMPVPTVLITADKAGAVTLLGLDAYIDDKLENANAVMDTVRVRKMLTRMYLKHAAYNDRPTLTTDDASYVIPVGRYADVRDVGLIVVNSVAEMLGREGL